MYGEIRSVENLSASKPTGRQILSASWEMLQEDRQLFWIPVISATASLIAGATLFYPGFLAGDAIGHSHSVALWAAFALAGFGSSTVAIFFQAALVIGAYQRADGIQPTLGGVLAAAWKLRGPVLAWALLATTVGVAIRALENRLGWLGRLLGLIGGLAWAVVSFLVVPVVVAEGLGPIEAVKRSGQLLRDTWGTSLRTTLRFGWIQMVALIVPMLGFFVGLALVMPGTDSQRSLGIVILAISIVALFALGAVFAAVSTYSRALIYRYATGLAVPGVEPEVFGGAFVARKRRSH